MNQPTEAPRYAVVSFTGEQPSIVAHGVTSPEVFRRQFLDPYEMGGERHHPGEPWKVHGALLATDGSTVVSVPIVTWQAPDGTARFLCQATDDGSAPALSAFATSEGGLGAEVAAVLRA